jgi:hypothetical protein
LIGALRNDLIVLNDYQPATSIFPIRSNLPWTEKIFDEVAVNDKKQTAAWAEFLSRPQLDVDFIVAWGAPKGAANCANWDWIRAPLEEALKARHDLLLVREGTSRVALWHRRDGPIKF